MHFILQYEICERKPEMHNGLQNSGLSKMFCIEEQISQPLLLLIFHRCVVQVIQGQYTAIPQGNVAFASRTPAL